MITKEKVGYGMKIGKTSKMVQEQIDYRNKVKECSLCGGEVDAKGGMFGEFGYIHHRYWKDENYYEYFFLVLCVKCFDAIKVVMHELREKKVGAS